MFRGQLKKFQSTKRSRKENNRKAQKRKAAREEDNFDLIVKQFDGKTPIQEVDVQALMSLKGKQLYWLRRMTDKKPVSDRACLVR